MAATKTMHQTPLEVDSTSKHRLHFQALIFCAKFEAQGGGVTFYSTFS